MGQPREGKTVTKKPEQKLICRSGKQLHEGGGCARLRSLGGQRGRGPGWELAGRAMNEKPPRGLAGAIVHSHGRQRSAPLLSEI